MAETVRIKVQQKLTLDAFKELNDQLKTAGVHIIVGQNPSIEYVKAPDVVGRVHAIFKIGKRLDVDVSAINRGSWYHFSKKSGVYYLIRSDE